MEWFEIAALVTTLAALFSYLNHRLLGLPTTIGLMAISLVASLALVGAGYVWPGAEVHLRELVAHIEFDKTVMHGLLGFLLFAGALHVDLGDLAEQKAVIGVLATVGVIISTALVGTATWAMAGALGFEIRFIHCLLFGALITPTDPIAVLAILKSLGAPKSLETKIAGESLFNDGVGVVVFLAIAGVAGLTPGHEGTAHAAASQTGAGEIVRLFLLEVGGGVAFGLIVGLVAYRMLKSVDNYQVEVLISLALVAGGYVAANRLHISGPLAMVVAGLLIGNHGRALAMSARTREHLDTFWELIDEILNAVLFLLIGLEVVALSFSWNYLGPGLLAIVIVLAARALAVAAPLAIMARFRSFTPHATTVLVWSGLRGGISVALALSLKATLGRQAPASFELILFMTYAVVVFSIIVQGLTVAPLLRRLQLTER